MDSSLISVVRDLHESEIAPNLVTLFHTHDAHTTRNATSNLILKRPPPRYPRTLALGTWRQYFRDTLIYNHPSANQMNTIEDAANVPYAQRFSLRESTRNCVIA